MKKTGIFIAFLLLAITAHAGTKRKPANTPNVPCLNSVSESFHNKWDPIRDQIRTEAGNLPAKQKRALHKESRRLLLAKAEAIRTCNSNAKNLSLEKVLAPFK